MHRVDSDQTCRILLVAGAFPPVPCGVGDYTYHLAHALSAKGVDVHVLTSADSRVLMEHPETAAAIQVHPIVLNWSLSSLAVIHRVIKEITPSIVHIQYPAKYGKANRSPTANVLNLCAKIAAPKVPVVTTLHEFGERSLLWRARATLNALTSDAVVCINRYDVDRVRKIVPRHCVVSHVPLASAIPVMPFDESSRANLRLSLGIRPNEIALAYFGFITPLKGFETLLSAIQRMLRASLPVKLIVISQLSPDSNVYHRQILQRIDQLGIASACVLSNTLLAPRDVSLRLQTAEMAVLPFVEGASDRRSSLIACLSHGLPVITTAGPDTPCEFVTESNVLLISAEDPAAIAMAAIRLVKEPRLRSQIAEGARRLGARFSWDGVANRTIELYDALCASLGAPTMQGKTDQGAPRT